MENKWNLNILCVDADEDILKFYQGILGSSNEQTFSVTRRYVKEYGSQEQQVGEYHVFPAMSGKAAIRTALEAKNKSTEIAVGFFDIGICGSVDGVACIKEIKRIFPCLLCAVVTESTDQGVDKIRELFESQDEWLYIKKPFTMEELLQTACNLIVSWNLRQEQTIAMNKIKESQERVQRLLMVTPKLFRIQTYEELCKNVVEEASDIMSSGHAFLAMRRKDKMEFMEGKGKFLPQSDEDKAKFCKVLYNPLDWDQGCLVPLSVGETPLGLLFIDDLPPEKRDTEILELFTSQAVYAFENMRIQAEQEEQKMREQELKIGQTIQESLLPKIIPQNNDIEVYGLMHSAREIGGDYYDLLHRSRVEDDSPLEDIFVSIGDVSGKGVAAGLIMSEVRSFIRALTPYYESPRAILEQVAKLLEKDIWGTGKFMSVLLMYWDTKKKKFIFSSAGHEHIIHYQAKRKKCSVFKAGGVVLGLKYNIVIPHLKEQDLEMESEDMILLFTDGVTEAMNAAEEMFSLERVVELVEMYAHLSPSQLLENVYRNICDFMGDVEQFDDITMVAVKKKKS